MRQLFLGLDVGTKNVKAILLSSDGVVVEKSSVPVYDLLLQPEEDFSERNPRALWERVKETLSRLKFLNKVSGICVDGTSGTILLIDRDGREMCNLIMYNDSRGKDEVTELREKSSAAKEFEKYLPLAPQLVVPKLMWLKKNFREFNRTYKVLHESDYIVFKLSGEIATSSNVAGKSHALLDGKGYLKEVYDDVGIPLEIMPEIKPIGAVVGYSSEKMEELGVPRGTPIVNGVTDATAGDVTSGALNPGQASCTIGTSLTVHAVTDKIVPDEHGRFYYKTYVNNSYLAGGFTNAGTTAIDTVSKIMKMSLNELTEAAKTVPPGCEGLIACTEWFGVRVPKSYPQVKGFIFGMTEKNTSPAHIFRSLLEGGAIALKLMLSAVEEVTGTTFYDLRASGGATKNILLMQIVSDAVGKSVKVVEEPDSALGSAIIAACKISKQDLNMLVAKTVKIKTKIEPNIENKSIYNSLAEKYKKLIQTLASIS
ncbi:MAG: xylulokinase [Nitrososphaeria archaeon]